MKASRDPSFLQRQWQRGGWLSEALRPLGALVSYAVARKRSRYRSGRNQTYRAAVPVIVVGNVYVGGTGKTPVVIAIAHALRARGYTPGIVSRGYGAKLGKAARVGQGLLAPGQFGDEPALIAAATQAPVAVHPRRPLAVQALLAAYPDVDVVVSDDGLQHLALARDVEIVVQDERRVGNGRLLPAGPLREPPARLLEVDAVVTNRSAAPAPALAPHGGVYHVDMFLEADQVERLTDGARIPLAQIARQSEHERVIACAGIGNPERFFRTLRQAGVRLGDTVALPDHYDYARSPFTGLDAAIILITAKDAIKCGSFDDSRLWSVPVSARFSDTGFLDWVVARIAPITTPSAPLPAGLPERRKLL